VAILIIRGFVYINFYFPAQGAQPSGTDEIPVMTICHFHCSAILTFSPCEALLPVFFAASPYGWQALSLWQESWQ